MMTFLSELHVARSLKKNKQPNLRKQVQNLLSNLARDCVN